MVYHTHTRTLWTEWYVEVSKKQEDPGGPYSRGSQGAVMVAAEASSFDMTVVFASQLGQVALDAHMAMLNVGGLTFVTGPLAFGIAANIRVGNLLGGGEPAAARVASIISVAAGTAWMVGPPPTVPNSA